MSVMRIQSRKSSCSGLQSAVSGRVQRSLWRSSGRQSAACGLRFGPRRGLTLIELLIVIAVMATLAALLFPAFSKVRDGALTRQAQMETRLIGQAIAVYRLQERGQLPAPAGVYGDGQPGGSNRVVMVELRADPPLLDVDKLRWDGDGNVLNPWGKQYTIEILESSSANFREQASMFYTEVVYSGMP